MVHESYSETVDLRVLGQYIKGRGIQSNILSPGEEAGVRLFGKLRHFKATTDTGGYF